MKIPTSMGRPLAALLGGGLVGTRSGAMEQLNGGSCQSATNCWAVGSYVPPGGDTLATLNQALHWDGGKW